MSLVWGEAMSERSGYVISLFNGWFLTTKCTAKKLQRPNALLRIAERAIYDIQNIAANTCLPCKDTVEKWHPDQIMKAHSVCVVIWVSLFFVVVPIQLHMHVSPSSPPFLRTCSYRCSTVSSFSPVAIVSTVSTPNNSALNSQWQNGSKVKHLPSSSPTGHPVIVI